MKLIKILIEKSLIECNCDNDTSDKYGSSLLSIAIKEGRLEVVMLSWCSCVNGAFILKLIIHFLNSLYIVLRLLAKKILKKFFLFKNFNEL